MAVASYLVQAFVIGVFFILTSMGKHAISTDNVRRSGSHLPLWSFQEFYNLNHQQLVNARRRVQLKQKTFPLPDPVWQRWRTVNAVAKQANIFEHHGLPSDLYKMDDENLTSLPARHHYQHNQQLPSSQYKTSNHLSVQSRSSAPHRSLRDAEKQLNVDANATYQMAANGKGHYCINMTKLMSESKKYFPTESIPRYIGKQLNLSIVIENRTQCTTPSGLILNMTTNLNVTVESCCITSCNHEIQIEVSENENILLNFGNFNVPGLNLARSEAVAVCEESLDILVDMKQKNSNDIEFLLGTFCGIKAPTSVFVEHSKAKLVLRLKKNAQCIDKINFDVQIVPCLKVDYKPCNDSEYVKFGQDQGYISSPGLGQGQNYPNDLSCQWSIRVPVGKFIHLESKEIRLRPGDFIHIQVPTDPNTTSFPNPLKFSNHDFQQPVVLPSNNCTVFFQSDSLKSGVGFNLTYTAVDESHFIPLFANNSLDCSNKAQYKFIPKPLLCNFHIDCANGEDEENCTYKQPGCWPTGYALDGHCYTFVFNRHNMSWTMAEEYCERNLSSYLVTISTVEERNFLDKLFDFLGSSLDVMFLGLRRMRMQQVRQLYRRMWQWTDGRTAFFLPDEYRYEGWSTCSLFHRQYFHSTECNALKENVSFICERTMQERKIEYPNLKRTEDKTAMSSKISVFHCPKSGEYISKEQRCDKITNCFDQADEENCNYEEMEDVMFSCERGGLLAYTFVCDGIEGCTDSSDEATCKTPDKATLGLTMTACTDGAILERWKVCDGKEDCRDSSDEEDCTGCTGDSSLCPMIACLPKNWTTDQEIDCPIRDLKGGRAPEASFRENIFRSIPPPGYVVPDGYGKFKVISLNSSHDCPSTHRQCDEGYCIPVYMWCNKMKDCPHGEDENTELCEKMCVGMYKCKYSTVCVHYDHLCDGYYQCPYHDDEILCSVHNLICPTNCTCVRMEITCTSYPSFPSPTPIRYLRLQHAEVPYFNVTGITSYSLIYLNASKCGVNKIVAESFKFLNLRIVDLSGNQIDSLPEETFKFCPSLDILILSNNGLFNANFSFLEHTRHLTRLDLSHNTKYELEHDCFRKAAKLEELIMRNMNIIKIHDKAFASLLALRRLDLKGNNLIFFSSLVFSAQKNMRSIITDNFRLCCTNIKPPSVQHADCEAPYDEISSCADILRTLILRVSLWLMAVLTITGNVGVIVYRIFYDRGIKYSFRIIITCLSASDLIMGIYLVIIGTADVIYRDRYLLVEREWKNSVACQVAGFLCLLSSETSALFILLVTIDRLLAIAFPLHPALHFNGRSAAVACAFVWAAGLIMAFVPLLPPFQHWELYSHKAVGVPLPITRSYFPGYDYAFSIFILFNMAVFLLVAIGQLLIYLSVRLQKHPQISAARVRQDTAIAKRLILVVITDCLCWFPITVMGLAARSGQPVPGEMYLVATVFLLPANSAFNPFLYTANAILLARRNRQKKKMELMYGTRLLT